MLTEMNWLQVFACLGLGLCVSWSIILFTLKRSSRHWDAIRGGEFHHAHKAPIPRLGGIAIAVAFTACACAIFMFIPLSFGSANTLVVIVVSSLAMFALGLWDDIHPLGAKFKLASQIAISAGVY